MENFHNNFFCFVVVIILKCMNSKKVPLWIATKSKEDENINILFKCGDDIR